MLKPCPLCGSEAEISETKCKSFYYCSCKESNCGMETNMFGTEQLAMEEWNNRPIENELIEALEEALRVVRVIGITFDTAETSYNIYQDVIDKAENAISKAKGEVK